MRILNLCVESDRIMGGRGEMNCEVMTRLQTGGHDVHHVCLDATWIKEPSYSWSIPSERWPMPCFERPGIAAQVMHSTVIHCLKLRKTFDVIVAHDWDMFFVASELSKVWGIPWVATCHLFQHQMALIEGRDATEEGMLPIANEWFGVSKAPHVVCVSNDMARYAREIMGVHREFSIIHNGVQPIIGVKPRPPTTNPRCLFIGRLSFQKGYDYVLDLAEKHLELLIDVAGSMPALPADAAEESPTMRRIRALEKSNPNFTYHGHVSRYERDAVYDRADCVLMPSRAEPFGIVALEAMARGIPLVTTRVDGLAEFCDDSNSWRCDLSVESLYQAIKDAALGDARVERALTTAKEFSWDTCAKKWNALLKGIVNGINTTSELRV